MNAENPLIIQGDRSLLLDVHAPLAEECRNALIPFAELEKSPEHLHTYRLTPLSLWNAASAGFSADDAIKVLQDYSRYDVPQSVSIWIKEISERFGKIRLIAGPEKEVPLYPEKAVDEKEEPKEIKTIKEKYLYLVTDSLSIYKEMEANPALKKYIMRKVLTDKTRFPKKIYISFYSSLQTGVLSNRFL